MKKLLFLFLLCALPAHAQYSRINTITLRNSNNTQAAFYAAPFTVKLGANCTWAVSGTTATLNCTGGTNPVTSVSTTAPITNGGTTGAVTIGCATCLVSTAFAALTDGATITWGIGSAAIDNKTLLFTTHGGSRTLNITGPVSGGSYVLKMTQDGTGGEGLILGTGCTWKVSGGGSGAITPSTGVSAIDVLAFTYDGTNCLANFNKNFN